MPVPVLVLEANLVDVVVTVGLLVVAVFVVVLHMGMLVGLVGVAVLPVAVAVQVLVGAVVGMVLTHRGSLPVNLLRLTDGMAGCCGDTSGPRTTAEPACVPDFTAALIMGNAV